jgi:hypothetical protein
MLPVVAVVVMLTTDRDDVVEVVFDGVDAITTTLEVVEADVPLVVALLLLLLVLAVLLLLLLPAIPSCIAVLDAALAITDANDDDIAEPVLDVRADIGVV